MNIEEKVFNQILNFREEFTDFKDLELNELVSLNVKIQLNKNLYDYVVSEFCKFFRFDSPFSISGFEEYKGESGMYFPEQGFLQLYEIEEEENTIRVDVFYKKELVKFIKIVYYK